MDTIIYELINNNEDVTDINGFYWIRPYTFEPAVMCGRASWVQ